VKSNQEKRGNIIYQRKRRECGLSQITSSVEWSRLKLNQSNGEEWRKETYTGNGRTAERRDNDLKQTNESETSAQ
jgi:hypothetical protein